MLYCAFACDAIRKFWHTTSVSIKGISVRYVFILTPTVLASYGAPSELRGLWSLRGIEAALSSRRT